MADAGLPGIFGDLRAPAAVTASSISLRDYQRDAVAAIDGHRGAGARVLCVAPTGAGKTTIFCRLVADEVERGGRALVIAHRTELIEQAFGRLVTSGIPDRLIGVVMADGLIVHPTTGRRTRCIRPLAPVQVASIDTLRRRTKPAGITLAIIDECHRALSKSYLDIFAAYPDAVHLGFTATPYRGDGRGLGDAYRVLVQVTTPKALMAAGFLAEPRVFSHPHRADLSSVKTTAGDYDQEQLAEAVDKVDLIGSIVDHWATHLQGVRTVAFAANVEHSKHIVEMFRGAGVPAEHLDGETPAEERAGILRRIDSGETLVVGNCGVLCEGWDQPSVKGAILSRPTKSRALYVQCAGRVLRPWENTTPIILDHAGCVLEHDLPHADWEISLEGRSKKKPSITVKECPKCFGAIPSSASVCTYCGTPFGGADAPGRELSEVDGQLVEVHENDLRALKRMNEATRAELGRWALAVDRHYQLAPGTTNRECMRKFRESRTKMSPARLEEVRAWFLRNDPWLLATKPAPAAVGGVRVYYAPITVSEEAPAW